MYRSGYHLICICVYVDYLVLNDAWVSDLNRLPEPHMMGVSLEKVVKKIHISHGERLLDKRKEKERKDDINPFVFWSRSNLVPK